MLSNDRDQVRDLYPPIPDDADWQQRPIDQMTSLIWHGENDDHGAMTRYGMGWGPLEVVRANRVSKREKGEDKIYRTLEIFAQGKKRLTITFTPTGRAYTIKDERYRAQDSLDAAVMALRDAVCAMPRETVDEAVWDALSAVEKIMAR